MGELVAEYGQLLGEIKQRIRSAQYAALKAVNKDLIVLYWDIGKLIVERQQGETWGKSIVEQLAKDLRAEFPGISGFSSRNIWRMRDFYLTYHANEKLTPLVAEISWTHNLIIRLPARIKQPVPVRSSATQQSSSSVSQIAFADCDNVLKRCEKF